ncbi:DUF6959 family protein [Aeromicrobium sp. SORGH_AS_0981]|jgi:predicted kinase|uniref:DUF6959 family protein n=1 Tax=Aeromicrobium sp. SORGH_AS_0981 TaxID=3041802 RepID=UPI0037C080E8
MEIEALGRAGNVQLARDLERKFPGLLIQGDTLRVLLSDLQEEAPGSFALETVQQWISAYEELMSARGLRLPY